MRKYRLRVGLDVDDVLYICNEYAISLLRKKYGDDPALDIQKIKTWGLQNNISDERIAMFDDPDFVRNQPLYPGAQKFVHELSKLADVFFVTAVPAQCMTARAERLKQDFPEVPTGNIIIGTRKDVISLDVLLDDAAHNISNSQANYPVLMRRPWNINLSGILSVNTYSDFLHLIRMIRNSFVQKFPDVSSGGVICLVGPSGTGKTEIAETLRKDKRYRKPLTTTTRERLTQEPENNYRFISEEQFLQEMQEGQFLETTVYSKSYYGTSKKQIDTVVAKEKIAVIPVDICGALTIKNTYKSKALLVSTTRSKENILLDIIQRETSNEDKINRMMSLDYELRNSELCDIAVNFDDGVNVCVTKIKQAVNQQKNGGSHV